MNPPNPKNRRGVKPCCADTLAPVFALPLALPLSLLRSLAPAAFSAEATAAAAAAAAAAIEAFQQGQIGPAGDTKKNKVVAIHTTASTAAATPVFAEVVATFNGPAEVDLRVRRGERVQIIAAAAGGRKTWRCRNERGGVGNVPARHLHKLDGGEAADGNPDDPASHRPPVRGLSDIPAEQHQRHRVPAADDVAGRATEARFEVAKWAVFRAGVGAGSDAAGEGQQPHVALELQVVDGTADSRVVLERGGGGGDGSSAVASATVYRTASTHEALATFAALHVELGAAGFTELDLDVVGPGIGSAQLQRLAGIGTSTAAASADGSSPATLGAAARLVRTVFHSARQSVKATLGGDLGRISSLQLQKAEVLLLQLRALLRDGEGRDAAKLQLLSQRFYDALPDGAFGGRPTIAHLAALAKAADAVSLMRDLVPASEAAAMHTASPDAAVAAMMASLPCQITRLDEQTTAHGMIQRAVRRDNESPDAAGRKRIRLLNVFQVRRPTDQATDSARAQVGNEKLLFHSSRHSSFYGILSRGLQLPQVVVDDMGGTRTDAGMLGQGIYFGDRPSTAANYSAHDPSQTGGHRLMLASMVALGKAAIYTSCDTTLSAPPDGFQSCMGVSAQMDPSSVFKDNEFAVYDPDLLGKQFVIEFAIEGEDALPVPPEALPAVPDPAHSANHQFRGAMPGAAGGADGVAIDDVLNAGVAPAGQAGLVGPGGTPLPLVETHLRAQLIDLAARVVVFQAYQNTSDGAIEAKYLFPVAATGTVCGFEAFINGKHVVGEVKEKEVARKEYREAIARGDGAYLMEESKESPEVYVVTGPVHSMSGLLSYTFPHRSAIVAHMSIFICLFSLLTHQFQMFSGSPSRSATCRPMRAS